MEVSFPDRYHLAVAHFDQVFGNLEETTQLDDMKKLAFYALRQQAEKGPCKEPAPYLWNVTERYKHAAWSQLGNMSTFEAMVYFVKQLEEVCGPDWMHATSKAPGSSTTQGGDEKKPNEEIDAFLQSASPEELRQEIRRLRSLLQQHNIPFHAEEHSRQLVQQQSDHAPEGAASKDQLPVEIPKRPEPRSAEMVAPPVKPTSVLDESGKADLSGTATGPVYYSSRKLGWLEWLGVTSPPQDSRIV